MNTNTTTSSSRLVGYARVSTGQQDLQLQLDALRKAGVAKDATFKDKLSGAKSSRPGLDLCLTQLKSGDTLVVWRLDRLGRSVRHLIDIVEDLRQRGVGFKSLCESIDTGSANGKLTFHLFTALAEFERDLIRERTNAGLKAARARGRLGGRPRIPLDDPRIQTAKKLHADKSMVIADICTTLQVSRPTIYRWLSLNSAVASPA
jgi:DNA invertase Pin-like site-specific DNA recombinase